MTRLISNSRAEPELLALPNAYQIELGRRNESVVRCVGDQAKALKGHRPEKVNVFGPEYHRASPLSTSIFEPGLPRS